MNDLVLEWITVAEGDFRYALLGLKTKDALVYNGVCFHCQQCIEKYLKALLVREQIYFEKKHDLIYLLDLLLPTDPTMEFFREELKMLTDYAVDIRYPGDHADYAEATLAVRRTKALRKALREKLGLAKPWAKRRK